MAPGFACPAPRVLRMKLGLPEADKSAVGTMMQINKLSWTCSWVCRGADKSAMGTINRPLQAFCPRSRCPGYFVNVHNRPLRFGVAKGDGAFDLFDQVGYMDATGAGVGTVEDGTTAPYTI